MHVAKLSITKFQIANGNLEPRSYKINFIKSFAIMDNSKLDLTIQCEWQNYMVVKEMRLVDQQSNDSSCWMSVIWHQKVVVELMGCNEHWNPNCKIIT